ncbi:MAG: glycosyltransferase, partial [bacterium]
MIVDIILPIYKPTNFVYKAINSVINQTYTNWHLYIIDDASRDGGLEKIKKHYNKYYDKITFYQFNKNRRAAACRNYAIRKGKGKYIAFIDQDDIWHRKKLEKYVNYITNNSNTYLLHSNINVIDKNNKILPYYSKKENNYRNNFNYKISNKKKLAENLYNIYSVRLCTILIARKQFLAIKGFNTNYFGGEDEEFIVRFA